MIEHPTIGLLAILIQSIGVLLAEKRTALLLGLATILTIIIFFIINISFYIKLKLKIYIPPWSG